MGTKSKNLTKVALFAVLIVSFCMAMFGVMRVVCNENGSFRYSYEQQPYNVLSRAFDQLRVLLSMRNEEFITSGEYMRTVDNYRGENLRELSEEEINQKIVSDLATFRLNLEAIRDLESRNIFYYAQFGDIVYANMDYPHENNFDMFMAGDHYDGRYTVTLYYTPNGTAVNGRIFVAFDNDYAAELEYQQQMYRAEGYDLVQQIVLMAIPGLVALIGLIWLAGGKLRIDMVWNEVILGAAFIVVMLYIVTCGAFAEMFFQRPITMHIVSSVFLLVGMGFFLMFVRNIKNGRLLSGFLFYKICAKIWGWCRELVRLTPLSLKLSVTILGGMFVTFLFGVTRDGAFAFFALMTAILVLWFILKYIMRPYDDEVAARLAKEVDAKMKSERLKTELITNVSHDLKTPITAILNYSDLLLKRDPKDLRSADEYAMTIHTKAQKLRALTEDLFEVAKAQSRNIDVKLETLDLGELIDQTLAELDKHKVDFKINLKEKAFVADGTLMSRVFGNLIGNIAKYSLDGTRAYIDSYEEGGRIVIIFKNIANYEMNFNSNEIAERFKRGDDSRSTEGNGLGLAIAKSYTEACGGRMDIDVDGDLFKVTVGF